MYINIKTCIQNCPLALATQSQCLNDIYAINVFPFTQSIILNDRNLVGAVSLWKVQTESPVGHCENPRKSFISSTDLNVEHGAEGGG